MSDTQETPGQKHFPMTREVLVLNNAEGLSSLLEVRPQDAGVMLRILKDVDFDKQVVYLLVASRSNQLTRYLFEHQRVSRQHQKVFHDFLMDPNNWKYLV